MDAFRYALLSYAMIVSVRSDTSRIVLPQGPVTGIKIFSGSRTRVNAFLGVPYALPPIGELRFAAPVRHPGWNATLFAGHFRPDCPQLQSEDGSSSSSTGAAAADTDEDCLYLNVFVPDVDTTYRNLPVAVFVHGIDHVSGSPLVVTGEELSSEGVILVTVGYRLNVFGFLTFDDGFARGNLGLLDQYMALVWVRENIKYFGGSPGNVTLVGHGSGAASALVHLTSPRTTHLFHRVVLMSGSVFSPWLRSRSDKSALLVSRCIARSVGCYGENFPVRRDQGSRAVVACLRRKSKDEILRAFQSSYKNGNWSEVLAPIADDFLPPEERYLPVDPVRAILQGTYRRVPILVGATVNEGTLTLHKWKDLISGRDEEVRYFAEATAITDVLAKYNFTSPEARLLVTWYYFERDGVPAARQLLRLYNDAMYAAPFQQQLRALSRSGGDVFVYLFAQPSFEYLGNYGHRLNLSEASHGAELSFLFGPSLFQKVSGRRFTASEERLSIRMKRFWTSFMRTGNPNSGPVLWDKYTSSTESYLRFRVDSVAGDTGTRKDSGNVNLEADTLWNRLLPRLQNATRTRRHSTNGILTSGTRLEGSCLSYKNAMFTVLAFLIVLLLALVLSLLLLKKRTKERDRNIL